MSSANLATCSVCRTTLDPNGTCPHCRAPEDWNDRIEAVDFVVRRLKDWHKDGQLTDRQLTSLTERYDQQRATMGAAAVAKEKCPVTENFPPRDECWSCREYLYVNSSHCQECGAPLTHPAVRSLRYYRYLYIELQAHEESGMLTLRQAHEFLSDTKERIQALKTRLEKERAPLVVPIAEHAPPPPRRRTKPVAQEPEQELEVVDEGPRRSFLEVMLDPQSIQWLLMAGGALIVLGLIIWLASLGVFQNPGFIAVMLGVGNAALIGGGYFVILKTRYQHAGRAFTLLACLVMPLNLWFYHSHDLLTLQDHLWIAALVCCIVYAASAYVLKDGLFVYALVAGLTLTGLLMLAERERFWEVAPSVTLLIVLGLACLHAERAFPPDIDSPFSRKNFGMPFYWSSQFLFAVGLLMLLGAQVMGWLYEPLFRPMMRAAPDVATRPFLPWTLALVLAGTYAYIYSDLVVRRVGVYLYLAAITLIWAEIHILVMTNLGNQEAILIGTFALTAMAINVLQVQFATKSGVLRVVPPMGVLLSTIPVVFGVLLHFRAVNSELNRQWMVINEAGNRVAFEISWSLVGAMAVVAICCRAGAFLYRRTLREVSVFYFFLTGAATLIFAAELTWMIGLQRWEVEAPIIMLIPILYLVASYLYKGHTPEDPLVWVAHAATGVMIFCSLWAALDITPQMVEPVLNQNRNLLFALFCLEVSIFYGYASFLRRSNWTMYFSAVMLCGALWQALIAFHLPHEYYTVTFALIGFILLVVYRVGVFEKFEMPGLERATFQSANALATLGFVAGVLLSLTRYFQNEFQLAILDPDLGDWRSPVRIMRNILVFLTIISFASVWLVQHPAWRRVYLVLTIINTILLVMMIHRLTTLDPWQKLEIFGLVVGVILLGLGHYGWYKEDEKTSDLVSFALFLGALALVLPVLIATIVYRSRHIPEAGWDDLGVVASCILLLGSGIVCRIKATTFIGAVGMLAYLVVILIGLHRHLKEQWIIGIYLFVGGVLLFGTGIILSVYRDRLLALPARIKRREGIFRFFDWR